MTARRRWFWWLLAVTLCLQTAVYAIRPMVSYRALEIGAGAVELGVITAAFAVLSLVVAVPIGRWIDRLGEIGFIAGGALAVAAVGLSLVGLDSIAGLVVSQAVLGLGHIACVAASQTLVANASRGRQRDGRYGVMTVMVSLGQLIGPGAAGLVAGAGSGGTVATGPVFLACGVLGLLAGLLALVLPVVLGRGLRLRLRRPPAPPSAAADPDGTDGRGRAGGAVRRVMTVPSMPQAMLASLTVITSVDILVAYLPAYGEQTGLPVTTVGFLLAVRGAASMVSRLLMLPLIGWLGRQRLLAWSMALPAAALAVLGFLDHVALLYAMMIVIGFGLGLGQPVTLSWVAAQAPADLRGTAIGLRLSGNRLGQTVLPVLVGGVGSALGLVAVFGALAVLLAGSTAAVWRVAFPDDAV